MSAGDGELRVPGWLWAAFAATVVLEVVVPSGDGGGHHGELPWWHTSPGFFAAFGLLACWSLVIVSRLAGKVGLQTPEEEAEGDAPGVGRGTH